MKKSIATATQIILTVEVDSARADAMYEWLAAAWEKPVVQLSRPNSNRVWLEVYFDDEATALLALAVVQKRREVRAAQIRICKPKDWQSFWRHHFKPQNIGENLRICPVWSKGQAHVRGRKTILVDPGLSFGTGEHFTTRFCLETIGRLCKKSAPVSMLDVGTGSGILAIAAVKLGCPRAVGTDNDALALEQAVKNARLNRVGKKLSLRVQDITTESPKKKYDLVCANILGPVLQQVAPALARVTRRHLVLSGIRDVDLDAVAESYLQQGGREIGRDGDGEWGGLLFEFGKSRS